MSSLKPRQNPIATLATRVLRFTNDANDAGCLPPHGIIRKLNYLKELGFDVVWQSPNGNGYDISDYQDHGELGTLAN